MPDSSRASLVTPPLGVAVALAAAVYLYEQLEEEETADRATSKGLFAVAGVAIGLVALREAQVVMTPPRDSSDARLYGLVLLFEAAAAAIVTHRIVQPGGNKNAAAPPAS